MIDALRHVEVVHHPPPTARSRPCCASYAIGGIISARHGTRPSRCARRRDGAPGASPGGRRRERGGSREAGGGACAGGVRGGGACGGRRGYAR